MPRLGFTRPRLGMAAGAPALAARHLRELTPMPRLGFSCPRLGMAAGAPALAARHLRELTPMPRLGFTRPRLGMAAGAPALAARHLGYHGRHPWPDPSGGRSGPASRADSVPLWPSLTRSRSITRSTPSMRSP